MIKNACLKDAEELAELNSVVQSIHAENEPGIFKSYSKSNSKKWFKSFLQDKNNHVLIAQDEKKMAIGYIAFTVKTNNGSLLTFPRKLIYIQHIAVNKAWQSKLIGEKLLKEVVRFAEKKKIDRLELDVWAFNKSANSFFEKHGFKEFNVKRYFSFAEEK